MLDQAGAAFAAAVVGNGGAELTQQDGYGTLLAWVDDLSMRFVVSFCSAALAHGTALASFIVDSRP